MQMVKLSLKKKIIIDAAEAKDAYSLTGTNWVTNAAKPIAVVKAVKKTG